MAATDVRGQITEQLFSKLEESRFIHVPLMNRVESRIRTRDELERYIEILAAKIKDTDFRSESLIDRLDQMAGKLERLDRQNAEHD